MREEKEMREILTLDFSDAGPGKKIHLMTGSISAMEEETDLLVCSAYKGDYTPVGGTLIGGLMWERKISVRSLALDPELDLRSMGCWLSRETGTCFKRIACVELLSPEDLFAGEDRTQKILTSTFSTLRFLCEQADLRGIPLRTMTMPILGTGNQGIDMTYVAPALYAQLQRALRDIEQLKDIYIAERSEEKAFRFRDLLVSITADRGRLEPDVFISYSSRQEAMAHEISASLAGAGIPCWIAPESIPPGSSYLEEIAAGLGVTRMTLLVLTPDAEASRWVRKEVGSSIGAGHILLPYQKDPYVIGKDFRFLLDGEQILEAWKWKGDPMTDLTGYVRRKLEA